MNRAYAYESPVGCIHIVQMPNGRWHVIFRDRDLGSYARPEQAADDVACGHTFSPGEGIDFASLGIPENIREWQRRLL